MKSFTITSEHQTVFYLCCLRQAPQQTFFFLDLSLQKFLWGFSVLFCADTVTLTLLCLSFSLSPPSLFSPAISSFPQNTSPSLTQFAFLPLQPHISLLCFALLASVRLVVISLCSYATATSIDTWHRVCSPHDRGHLSAMYHTPGGKSQLVKWAPGQSKPQSCSF